MRELQWYRVTSDIAGVFTAVEEVEKYGPFAAAEEVCGGERPTWVRHNDDGSSDYTCGLLDIHVAPIVDEPVKRLRKSRLTEIEISATIKFIHNDEEDAD